MARFAPDVDYIRFSYIDRRDFVNQLCNEERLSDEELEEEFDSWLKGVQAKAWLEGYHRARIAPNSQNPYEEDS